MEEGVATSFWERGEGSLSRYEPWPGPGARGSRWVSQGPFLPVVCYLVGKDKSVNKSFLHSVTGPVAEVCTDWGSWCRKGTLWALKEAQEVEASTQEKSRNDTCHLPFTIHYLVPFLPHHIPLILKTGTEFSSKPWDLIKSWDTCNGEWASVVIEEFAGVDCSIWEQRLLENDSSAHRA